MRRLPINAFYGLPELQGYSDDDRRRIWQRAIGPSFRHWEAWAAMLVLLIVTPIPFMLSLAGFTILSGSGRSVGVMSALVLFLGAASGAISGVAAASRVLMLAMRPYIRRQLPGYCSKCAYDLTGNDSGRCPECGAQGPAKSQS